MDIRKVKKLIELLEESGIAEIEIKEGEEAVRISRMPTGQVYTQLAPALPPATIAAAPAAAPAAPVTAGAPNTLSRMEGAGVISHRMPYVSVSRGVARHVSCA